MVLPISSLPWRIERSIIVQIVAAHLVGIFARKIRIIGGLPGHTEDMVHELASRCLQPLSSSVVVVDVPCVREVERVDVIRVVLVFAIKQ